MKNHLLRFETEDAAKTALPEYAPDGAWREDIVIPGQSVLLARAVEDAEGNEIAPEVRVLGFFVTVSLPDVSEALRDLPGNACRLIGDSESGAILYLAPDVNPAVFSSAIVEPMPMGAAYTFGTG